MPPKTNQQLIDEATKVAQTASNVSGVSGGAYKPITPQDLTPGSVGLEATPPATTPVLTPLP